MSKQCGGGIQREQISHYLYSPLKVVECLNKTQAGLRERHVRTQSIRPEALSARD